MPDKRMIYDWEVPGEFPSEASHRIAYALSNEASTLIHNQLPDLSEFFPFNKPFHFFTHFDPNGWFGLRLVYPARAQMNVGPFMEDKDIKYLKERIEPYEGREYKNLFGLLGSEWYGEDRFTYVGSYQGKNVSWADMTAHLADWLNDIPVPNVLEKNRSRVLRAIPKPPSYNIGIIAESLWVLECEQESLQGTGFYLKDRGLITCDHVLGSATCAFRHDKQSQKFPVTVVKRNKVVDLAILSIDAPNSTFLNEGKPSEAQLMDHLMVTGHPNYRIGDSPLFIPGLIVGFRTISGVRRLLTNAPIVSGSSGGPVLDKHSRVIGVAVTGSDNFADQQSTEDHGIVPIDALDLF